jgi:Uma2 family endonuclease
MSLATDSHDSSLANTSFPSLADQIIAASDAPQFKHWRCSVEKYHEMVRWGIFRPEDRLEMLEGLIVQKHHPPDGPRLLLWRCSVEQYHEMTRRGILAPEDRVELLKGLIVQKMTKYPLHRTVAYRLVKVLERSIPRGFYVGAQDPVTLSTSEPEPDAAVIRGNSDDYSNRHPGPADIPLIAEVADSSLSDDRSFKKGIYAENHIAVYWIVNLIDRQIEVYSEPTDTPDGANYARREVFKLADNVPLVIDGRLVAELEVRSIIPEQAGPS